MRPRQVHGRFLLFGVLVAVAFTAPQAATLSVTRTTEPIEVDGLLDEPAWSRAEPIALSYEWFPGDGVEPPVRTLARVTFDERRLYVSFHALDPRPGAIRAHLMDRDNVGTLVQDDHVTLMIDTFNDQRRAYQFRINPLGVQADALFSEVDSFEDFSWDIIWESAGRIVDDGYIVELAIPFSQLRFPRQTGPMTWGFEFGRSYPRDTRHRMSAVYRDPSDNCLLCQIRKLHGFDDLESGLNLEITPTLTFSRTDARDPIPGGELLRGDDDVDPGISARWGVTPNLTLNGTINPDFSQVEADAAQLNVNERFALFFPEQRPFFLEGADFFAAPKRVVFTRTIADPEWGAKLTGKSGANAWGVFAAQDRTNNLLFPSNQGSRLTAVDEDVLTGVVRYRRDVGEASSIGLLLTSREGDGPYSNTVGAVDGQLRLSAKNELRVHALFTDTRYAPDVAVDFGQPNDSFSGHGIFVDWNRVTRKSVFSVEYEEFGDGFRADAGFIRRADYRRVLGVARRVFWGDEGAWYRRIQFGLFGFRTEDQSGRLTDELSQIQLRIDGPLQSYFDLEIVREKIRFGDTLFDDLQGAELYFEIQPAGAVKAAISIERADTVDFANVQPADLLLISPSLELKPGRSLNLQLDHTFQQLDVAAGELFTARLSELRAIYQLNLRTFVRVILQHQQIDRDPALFSFPVLEEEEDLFSQLLFSYKLNPQTVVFAGYSDNRLGTDQFDLLRTDRTFFAKLGYAWTR